MFLRQNLTTQATVIEQQFYMAKCASTSLTHNDFYPALVGEQTLTRSVILHNNYQEKENKFY